MSASGFGRKRKREEVALLFDELQQLDKKDTEDSSELVSKLSDIREKIDKLIELYDKQVFYLAKVSGKNADVVSWASSAKTKELEDFVESHSEAFGWQEQQDVQTGVVSETRLHNMVTNDEFRNILDIEWYRGTEHDEINVEEFAPLDLIKHRILLHDCNCHFDVFTNPLHEDEQFMALKVSSECPRDKAHGTHSQLFEDGSAILWKDGKKIEAVCPCWTTTQHTVTVTVTIVSDKKEQGCAEFEVDSASSALAYIEQVKQKIHQPAGDKHYKYQFKQSDSSEPVIVFCY